MVTVREVIMNASLLKYSADSVIPGSRQDRNLILHCFVQVHYTGAGLPVDHFLKRFLQ